MEFAGALPPRMLDRSGIGDLRRYQQLHLCDRIDDPAVRTDVSLCPSCLGHASRLAAGAEATEPSTMRAIVGSTRPLAATGRRRRRERRLARHDPYIGAMSAKREYMPWNATVTVLVGPLRCLATIRSASPARGLSFS